MTYICLYGFACHGHCLGFHIIPGSEGRKDPAAALYTHKELPPKIVFCDHTCSLSEYVKNRESSIFKNTRFFHDIFCGFTHKFSPAFRCSTLNGLEETNTSICEQFNSFIKRIKASPQDSQHTNFTFYHQFFIEQWNEIQQENTRKKNYNRTLGDLDIHPSQKKKKKGLFV